MIRGFRWAMTGWLLYNVWTGHTWALYLCVTLSVIADEVLMTIVPVLAKQVSFLRAIVHQISGQQDESKT